MMPAARPLLFVIAALSLAASAALAQPGAVESVRFESHPDRLDFVFTASTPIDGSLAEVIPARKGEVLILRLGGITAKRKWIKTRDRAIRRTLLHPSTERPPGAILRIRFKRRVITRDLVKDIQAEYIGDDRRTVLISVPRPPEAKRKAKAEAKTDPKPPEPPTTDPPPEEAPDPDPPKAAEPDPKPAELDPKPAEPEDAPPLPTTPPVAPPPTMAPAPPPTPAPAPFEAIIAPPEPRTADVRGGVDGLVDRLRLGIEQRPGVPRLAVLPLTALDDASHREHLDASGTELVAARLLHRPGLVMVDPARFEDGLERLHRRDDGRFALDDARALAAMLGADTLIAGSVLSDGDTVTLSGRAIDVASGRDLGATRQPFDRAAMRALSDSIREEYTASGAILRSALLPGLGQISQGHAGRGAGYLTGFTATLGAGIISAALGAAAESDAADNPSADGLAREDDANGHYTRATAFFVAAGAVWLASLVDAIVTSEDRVEYDLTDDAPPR